MKPKTLNSLVVLVILVLVAVGVACVIDAFKTMRDGRYASALLSLRKDTHAEIKEYFQQHGQYPSDLHELEYSSHRDEFTESMLEDLEYSVDGTNYHLQITEKWRDYFNPQE